MNGLPAPPAEQDAEHHSPSRRCRGTRRTLVEVVRAAEHRTERDRRGRMTSRAWSSRRSRDRREPGSPGSRSGSPSRMSTGIRHHTVGSSPGPRCADPLAGGTPPEAQAPPMTAASTLPRARSLAYRVASRPIADGDSPDLARVVEHQRTGERPRCWPVAARSSSGGPVPLTQFSAAPGLVSCAPWAVTDLIG